MKVYRVELKASGVKFKHHYKSDVTQEIPKQTMDTGKGETSITIERIKIERTTIERTTRIGPYCGRSDLPAKSAAWFAVHGMEVGPTFRFSERRHPDPFADSRLDLNIRRMYPGFPKYNVLSAFLYGFSSIRSLIEWFDEDIQMILDRAGYGVVVYESDEVCEGHKQVVFEPNTAKFIDLIHFDELYTPAVLEKYD